MKFKGLCEYVEALGTTLREEPVQNYGQALKGYKDYKCIVDRVLNLLKRFNKLLDDNGLKNGNSLNNAELEKQLTPLCQNFYDKNKDDIWPFEGEFFFELLKDNNYHISNKILKRLVFPTKY